MFNEKGDEMRRESLLTELKKRFRDVRQGPDGLLYALVDDEMIANVGEGAVLRIEPSVQGRRVQRTRGACQELS